MLQGGMAIKQRREIMTKLNEITVFEIFNRGNTGIVTVINTLFSSPAPIRLHRE
jgi:hypothetical protein